MCNQKLKDTEINLNKVNDQNNEEPFLPYGGKPFSKKTGFKHFDSIIDTGYIISIKSILKNSIKNYTKIFWKTILILVILAIFQIIPLAIVAICNDNNIGSGGVNRFYREMSDLDIFFVTFLSNLVIAPLIVKFLYSNVLKVLDKSRFSNIKINYLNMLGAISIFSFINLFLSLFLMSGITNINNLIMYQELSGINMNFINLMIFGILFVYFTVSYSFSLLLKIEYDYKILDSLQISRKVVTRNFSSVLLNVVIGNLIMFSGYIIFRYGIIFTYPLGLLYFCNLYITIFKSDGNSSTINLDET